MYNLIEDLEYNNTESYQKLFLEVFDLKEWDDEIVEKKLEILFKKIRNEEIILELLERIKNSSKFSMFLMVIKMSCNEEEYNLACFKLLFSYDLFLDFHKLLKDVMEEKEIEEYKKLNILANI